MAGAKTYRVNDNEAGTRVDRWLKQRFPDAGHGRIQKWLRTGQVRVDGGRVKAGARLAAGQTVRVPPMGAPAAAPGKTAPGVSPADVADLKARVLHRDNDVIVIDKPAGLAVQGGSGVKRHLDAMLDALRFGAAERPRLVHRLDKDTSGVLVLARNAAAARMLTGAFRAKETRKLYWAVVAGVPRPAQGTVDVAIAKVPGRGGERMSAADAGKAAVTHYRVIGKAGRKAAWVVFEPLSGRTHQLRVHAGTLGTPILGDGKYGGREAFLAGEDIEPRVHLHARAIRFSDPAGGIVEAVAPLPPHMKATFRALGFDARSEKELFADINGLRLK